MGRTCLSAGVSNYRGNSARHREGISSFMKSTSADLLEFEALKQLLARFIASPLGRAELDRVEPGSDRATLVDILAEVDEGIQYLKSAAQPKPAQRGAAHRLDFSGITDLRTAVEKLRIEGASLAPK